ncbi:LytR/AlgR family response regulator transcription factor [Larkinella insperata]|uniref:LytR/AlgR family response regulator transcription factor n=1 Tax=Larkinella insperata TaxID=332158 RepID=A0ABW3QIU0_9BACT|nr:LytTR family transcriptional regulator DNA-binding domain-containing protein [Larkinella insperata]
MWQLLRQPYPCEDVVRRRWVKAFWIGLFVGLFLLIFQPFGLNNWQTPYKAAKVLGFGLITFLITAFLYLVTPVLLPRHFSSENWTVGREILWITILITLIGLTNYFYLQWLIGNSIHGPDLAGTLIVTFLIGIFPAAASVVVNYIVRLKKYSESAREIPVRDHPETTVTATVEQRALMALTAENEKDSLILPPADLLYVESSDNYSTVVYLKEAQPAKVLLRSSLSRLESQLNQDTDPTTGQNTIVRCHRSYIVNLERVEKVTGNAQGYKLHLQNGTFQIPVARKYNDTLVARLKSLA